MKPRRSTEIWKSGIPLGVAWERYGNGELRNELATMAGAIETINSGLQGFEQASPMVIVGQFFGAFSSGKQQRRRRSEVIADMRSELLDDLFNGLLVATGYRVASKFGRDPVQIDPDLFNDPDIDWDKSLMRIRGEEYHDVRVTDPAELPSSDNGRHTNSGGSRPGIDAAIDRLLAENPEFSRMNRAKAAELVRRSIGTGYNSGNGLSDKNITKRIVEKLGTKRITGK